MAAVQSRRGPQIFRLSSTSPIVRYVIYILAHSVGIVTSVDRIEKTLIKHRMQKIYQLYRAPKGIGTTVHNHQHHRRRTTLDSRMSPADRYLSHAR